MSTEHRAVSDKVEKLVMRTFVRAWVAGKPDFKRNGRGIGFCVVNVVGEAAGAASGPPQVSLYIRDGGDGLRVDEAVRCGLGLNDGDLIEAVGNIGCKRPGAEHQEVIVTERVKLRQRAAGEAGAA